MKKAKSSLKQSHLNDFDQITKFRKFKYVLVIVSSLFNFVIDPMGKAFNFVCLWPRGAGIRTTNPLA